MSALNVVVTGAGGQIGYSLLPLICSGKVFGPTQRIHLRLLDIPQSVEILGGVKMELNDGAYSLVDEIVCTSDLKEAFTDANAAFLVGGFPRKAGMERKDLINKNALIFKDQGTAINDYANVNIKVLVVANPANTNAWTTMIHAPRIPKENITALTRLDHERLRSYVVESLKTYTKDKTINSGKVSKCIIWGNHSATQVPDITYAQVDQVTGVKSVNEIMKANNYDNGEMMKTIQQRGAAIIKARKLSSAMSAANAAAVHMHDWFDKSAEKDYVSVALLSDGNSYGVPDGLIYSFPCTAANGKYQRIENIACSDEIKALMNKTAAELQEEQAIVKELLAEKK